MGCLYWVAWGVYKILRLIPVSHFICIYFLLLWIVCFVFSFTVQKLLSLIKSHLFIFVFVFITLWGKSKKMLLWFTSECSASKSFIVSDLAFSFLIHLSLFLCMVLANVLILKGLSFIPVYKMPYNSSCIPIQAHLLNSYLRFAQANHTSYASISFTKFVQHLTWKAASFPWRTSWDIFLYKLLSNFIPCRVIHTLLYVLLVHKLASINAGQRETRESERPLQIGRW